MSAPWPAVRVAPFAASLSLLAGCGGSGGGPTATATGSVSIVASAPTPAPTPTPTPTPAQSTAVRNALGLTASQSLLNFGWITDATSGFELNGVETSIDLRWSATLGTYEATFPDIGSGRLAYTFPNNNPAAFSLIDTTARALPIAISLPHEFSTAPYRSAGTLLWAKLVGQNYSPVGAIAYGIPSTTVDLPAGRATYLTADTVARFNFDFAAGTFMGNIGIAWTDAWGPYAPTQYSFTQTGYARFATGFTARFAVAGAPTDGIVRGQFMGPRAEEVAIAWRAPIRNPYTDAWEIRSGVALGRMCSDCS